MTADLDVLAPEAESRLRAALDAAATTAPVAPAWETIRDRVEGDEVTALPRPSGSRTRVLALAAAVLALLAVGAVVVATRPDGSTVVTDETTEPAPEATGWYVPVGLPTGWVVDEVTATRPPTEPCPDGSAPRAVDGVVWVVVERRARISLQSWECPPTDDGDEPSMLPEADVDLGGGVTGKMLQLDPSDEPEPMITWTDDGRSWSMDGAGVTTDELIAAAEGAVADGPLATAPAGFTETDRWTAPGGATAEVGLLVTSPSGTRMVVRLNTPGRGNGRTSIDPEPYEPPGQELPVHRLWQPDGWWAMKVGGAWPGADLDVMVLVPVEPGGGSPAEQTQTEEVDALVGRLRPATTAEWQAFLADVDHTPVLDEAATFADLADLDVPPMEAPPDGTETTVAERPTTTLPG